MPDRFPQLYSCVGVVVCMGACGKTWTFSGILVLWEFRRDRSMV